MKTFLKYILILIFSFPTYESLSQNSQAISLAGQYGYVFPTNDYVSGVNTGFKIHSIYSSSFRYIFKTDGSKAWHKLYDYPFFGIGFNFFSFNNNKHTGVPISLSAFLSSKIWQIGKLQIRNDIYAGVSYFPKHWSEGNFENVAISTSFNCFIQEGLTFNLPISKYYELSFGMLLAHFSNGAMKRPNYGINTLSTQIGLSYNLSPIREVKQESIEIDFKRRQEIIVSLFGGKYNDFKEIKAYPKTDIRRYHQREHYAFGLNTTFMTNINYKNNIGFGFNLGYDSKANSLFELSDSIVLITDATFKHSLNATFFLSYEYKIKDFSTFIELGYYLYRKESKASPPRIFQRVGLRYNIYDNLFLNIAIRASYLSVAHYIEWGFGYRFKLFSTN